MRIHNLEGDLRIEGIERTLYEQRNIISYRVTGRERERERVAYISQY
jgi:hypothetical protein